MTGIAKRELSARRQRLRDELPNHGWDCVEAGIAAGYSRSYAKARLRKYAVKDSTFCQQVAAKRAEIEASTQDKREKCLKVLDSIIEDEHAAARDRIRATEVRGKMCGWMSETRVLKVPQRRRELSESEQEEARRLALTRFDTTRALPGETSVQDCEAWGTWFACPAS
jgi:hypothetical protein